MRTAMILATVCFGIVAPSWAGPSSGQLGQWRNLKPMPDNLSNQAFTVSGGHIYTTNTAWGNVKGGTWYAPLNPDGSPGTWTQTGSAPNENRVEVRLVVGKGALYTVGGHIVHNDPSTTVEYAIIKSDGSLGPWTKTSSLNTPRASAAVIVCGNYIYAAGGWTLDWGGWPKTVEYARINPDCSLGPWKQTSPMLKSRIASGCAAIDGSLYVIGGGRHNYLTSTVERATINDNGTLGKWVYDTPLPEDRQCTVAVLEGRIYVVGGTKAFYGKKPTISVLCSTAQPDHSLKPWAETSPLVSQAGPWATASAYKQWIYTTSASSIQMAVFRRGEIEAGSTVRNSSPTSDAPLIPRPDLSKSNPWPVIRVVEGDTFVVLGEQGKEFTLRLIGVDKPQGLGQDVKEASAFLTKLLKGKKVCFLLEGKDIAKDKHGRILVYAYSASDGLFINAEIITQGYGRVSTQFPFKYEKEFHNLERIARMLKKGLWASTVRPKPTSRKTTVYTNP